MNPIKLLLAAAAAAAVLLAFRDSVRGGWLPAGGSAADRPAGDEEEPVLGYDGMDRDLLIAWLRDANLDPETLSRVRDYEAAHQGREAVLEAVAELTG